MLHNGFKIDLSKIYLYFYFKERIINSLALILIWKGGTWRANLSLSSLVLPLFKSCLNLTKLFHVQGLQGPQGLPGPVGRRGVQVSQTTQNSVRFYVFWLSYYNLDYSFSQKSEWPRKVEWQNSFYEEPHKIFLQHFDFLLKLDSNLPKKFVSFVSLKAL